jgi:hypothetical protein
MTSHRRPSAADWRAGLLAGAASGSVVLGIGGRLGMRVVAVAQGRTPVFTVEGAIAVCLLGAAAGAIVAALMLVSRAAFPQRRAWRVGFFWLMIGVFVMRGLHPVTPLTAAVFCPLFVLHGALVTTYFCRMRLREPSVALTGA